MLAPWNGFDASKFIDDDAERHMDLLQEVVYTIRNIRGEMKMGPGTAALVMLVCADDATRAILQEDAAFFGTLTNLSELRILREADPPAFAATGVVRGIVVFVELPSEMRQQEIERLQKEIARTAGDRERLTAKLGNESFTSRAPAQVVEKEREKLRHLEAEGRSLEEKLARIQEA
jgi:valyl-tRNA synthetase